MEMSQLCAPPSAMPSHASRNHFDEFEPHTRLKHLILKTYLQAWARKLLLRPGAGNKVFFVDACAGRGMDDVGNHGSPVIAANEARIVEAQLAAGGRDVEVHTIAIEKRAGHYRRLAEVLAPFDRARAIRGELVDHLPAILNAAGTDPILCFIDPFGLEPLRIEVVRAILDRPHCEVFALFADQACLRHFGAASAAEDATEPTEPDLFSAAGITEAAPHPDDLEASEALAITAERAIEILDSAFGDSHWLERIRGTPERGRRAEFLRMYEEVLRGCGAPFVLSIPMRNDNNQHVYHLVHASKSANGYVAMKEAVSSALNHTDLDGRATDTIRFAIRSNLSSIASEIRTRFSGHSVPWTTASEDGYGPLRDYVLQNTPAFPHEIKELHEKLRAFRAPGKKIVYVFPEILEPLAVAN